MNDQIGPYFKTHQGLRQGDPLSPLLFNLAAEALTLLVQRAERNSLIEGLAVNEADLFYKNISYLVLDFFF